MHRKLIILFALFFSGLAMSSEEAFWQWFEANTSKIESYKEGDDEAILDEILTHLHAYNSSLYYEFSTNLEPNELVITAEGDPDQVDSVMNLVSAAPDVAGWAFIAFKPAHGFTFITTYEGVDYDPAKLWFLPLSSKNNPQALGLRVGIPNYDEGIHKHAKNAMYIVLDSGIGEKKVIENIDYLETVPLPKDPESEGYIELERLDEYIDYHRKNT
ncbi:hypothetical protein L4C36_19675 [Photobacterium japonica]|uniref:hypothetical protein n=1 Tax=Photobacterium japonica TaxID=2910235 RepID=UPI003D0B1796